MRKYTSRHMNEHLLTKMENRREGEKQMGKKKLWVCLLLCVLTVALLSGCGLHNEVLDREMQILCDCIETGDAEALRARFHPDALLNDQTFAEWFGNVQSVWRPIDSDRIDLTNLNVSTSNSAAGTIKTYTGVYLFEYVEDPCTLTLVYLEANGGKGLTNASFASAEVLKGTSYYISLAVVVILAALAVFTVIDIIQKKPRLYGLWIALVLLAHLTFILNTADYRIRIGIPIGAIIYWCVRKKLIKRRKERENNENPQ